jgi:hypothetical protein
VLRLLAALRRRCVPGLLAAPSVLAFPLLLAASLVTLPATAPDVPGLGEAGSVPVGAAAQADETRWSVLPSSRRGPTGRSRFEYALKPREEVADWVAVSNLGRRPLTVSLYGTDAFNAADGGFSLLPADRPPTGVGAWIVLPRSDFTVPVGKRVDVPFRLKVPPNATPGDHIGGLIASATETVTNGQGQRVNVERRVAARIYLRVDGPVRPVASITAVEIAYDNPVVPFRGGDMTITYRVANDGNVRFSGKARVQVKGPFGVRVDSSEMIDIPEVLPDSEVRIITRIRAVFPAGRLTAEVSVNPRSGEEPLPSMRRSASAWAVPWLPLTLIVLAVGAVVLVWLRRRRARRDMTPAYDVVSMPAPTVRAVALAVAALAGLGPLAGVGSPAALGALTGVAPPAGRITRLLHDPPIGPDWPAGLGGPAGVGGPAGPGERSRPDRAVAAPSPGGGAAVDVRVSIGPAATATPTGSPTSGPSPTGPVGTNGPSATPPPRPGGGALPRTGVAVGAMVLAGTVLAGGGAGLRAMAARRRNRVVTPAGGGA